MHPATLRKHGLNILDALLDLFVGNPQVLFHSLSSYDPLRLIYLDRTSLVQAPL